MKKILFINNEIVPFVPDSETSIKGKEVPQAILDEGFEIRTFTPKWGIINERRGQLHEVIRLSGLNIDIDDLDHQTLIKVASIPQTKIQVYFIDNDDFFMKRKMLLDENGQPYADNASRAIFYARAVIETVKKLRWTPDIIHCQGLMSAFVPLYLKKAYYDEPAVCNAKVVTSFFDNSDIAPLNSSRTKESLLYRDVTMETLSEVNDDFGKMDLVKLAVENSDGVIEASANVDADVKALIKSSGVKSLAYSAEDLGKSYAAFYDSLFDE